MISRQAFSKFEKTTFKVLNFQEKKLKMSFYLHIIFLTYIKNDFLQKQINKEMLNLSKYDLYLIKYRLQNKCQNASIPLELEFVILSIIFIEPIVKIWNFNSIEMEASSHLFQRLL